ncbi:MAG: sprT domain-containing protein [Flavobacteriaceae bacterium]|nr:sprT domain-containing protein [Flavobacteriaceae bacterium]
MKNFHVLEHFLPPGSVEMVESMLKCFPVNLRISKTRASKLGDFRPLPSQQFHIISINHDLNPFAFLITLVHEVAHRNTWNEHLDKVSPHGSEWKQHFRSLMIPYIEKGIFPQGVNMELGRYMQNPAASSCSSPGLTKALKVFDKGDSLLLDDVPTGSIFIIKDNVKLMFKKGDKARSRYLCLEMRTNRKYWVSGLAEVIVQPKKDS